MPIQKNTPGVFVEEIPNTIRTISGVSTSITAFVGRAKKGPVNDPVKIFSYSDYEQKFGGFCEYSPMSFAVHAYFLNGGNEAVIVRVHKNATSEEKIIPHNGGSINLKVEPSSIGSWSKDLEIIIDYPENDADNKLFNITINHPTDGSEQFLNVTYEDAKPNSLKNVLEQNSLLLRVVTLPDTKPETGTFTLDIGGSDGLHVGDEELFSGSNMKADKKGIYALEKVDLFNLLCIAPYTNSNDSIISDEKATDVTIELIVNAIAYCEERRAIFLVDPHSTWDSAEKALTDVTDPGKYPNSLSSYAALYFPRLLMHNPLNNQIESFVPSGTIAGIIARIDSQRGVWKAPAGLDAIIIGSRGLDISLTNEDMGKLNPAAINSLKEFPAHGNVIWGGRTLNGNDKKLSQWKYLPVRRTALFIEESLYSGLKWVVSEPNNEQLWAQVRLNVGAFLNNLFRQGAFAGNKNQDAYFIKCDSETNTQNDIIEGNMNIVLGFAPMKPAEFIIIKIQLPTGQPGTN